VTRAVDLVVAGGEAGAIAAAVTSARRGERVLVVIGPGDRAGADGVRDALRRAGPAVRRRVTVMTGAEIVCVDGVGGVEAVVVRHAGTGRLVAFNARAVVAPCR
jgi:hypothetical protein